MVEEFSSDREQEEALLNWWRENWRWIISGVVLGLAVLGGWRYWQEQKQFRAEAAAQIYSDFSAVLAKGDKDKVDQLVKELDGNYADSPYSSPAHLALAERNVSAGQFEQAVTELKGVVDKSNDAALVSVARLRLARVQLQLGHHDEALALLDVSKAGAFAAQVEEVRGDVLLAKGDRSGARLAYQAAMDARMGTDAAPSESELLRLKLQDLADIGTDAKRAADAMPTIAVPAPSPAAK